jgi:magnesium transporter
MGQMKKNISKVGKAPGSAIYTGNKFAAQTKIEYIMYSENNYKREVESNLKKIDWNSKENKWINIIGINEADSVKEVMNYVNLNSLVIEDILNIGHRPKIEIYEEYIFIIIKMLTFEEDNLRINSEQVSMILQGNTLITFQEMEKDVFGPIRKRIANNLGSINKKPCDYLLYSLIDAIVDNYYILLDEIEDKIDELEENIITNDNETNPLGQIYKLRKELLLLKTAVWPIKEIVNELQKDYSILGESTRIYLSDLNDHVNQIMDYILIYREMISTMFDTHLSNMSNRMNKVMTTLTIFSAIFIPITFLAGVYGMNFKYMPELSYKFGYPIFIILCVIIAITMFYIFKKKKWM